ncbi:hypothetical protein HA466_0304360 [Hirschfeldia incana]|nr:hypothetical protein HA466_0304360 [Hirschfeldia incana]KAJ0230899.1 hypothetical protein HA466_0304360 [Hirschfeldia incana]
MIFGGVCGAASKIGKRKTNNTDVHGRGLRVDIGISIACVKICIHMYNKEQLTNMYTDVELSTCTTKNN